MSIFFFFFFFFSPLPPPVLDKETHIEGCLLFVSSFPRHLGWSLFSSSLYLQIILGTLPSHHHQINNIAKFIIPTTATINVSQFDGLKWNMIRQKCNLYVKPLVHRFQISISFLSSFFSLNFQFLLGFSIFYFIKFCYDYFTLTNWKAQSSQKKYILHTLSFLVWISTCHYLAYNREDQKLSFLKHDGLESLQLLLSEILTLTFS